jgi:hypothetical protein
MAKNRKTVFKGFSYLQCDDFAAYLSHMAAKGWHFKEFNIGLVFEKGTPRSFCGVSFGKTAPEWATVVYPKNGDKAFFLDYTRAKCGIFKGFDVGKAKIDPYRGGVYEVVLYVGSGGFEGLDDATYYRSVRGSLDRHYAVKPAENPGRDGFPELVYTKGDLKIVFGPDINGGFRLSAVNGVLAQIAKTKPVEKRRGRR